MNTLRIEMMRRDDNKSILEHTFTIPKQEYDYWIDEEGKQQRRYVTGGFHNGKFAEYFRWQVADTLIREFTKQYPNALLPDREDILNTLEHFN